MWGSGQCLPDTPRQAGVLAPEGLRFPEGPGQRRVGPSWELPVRHRHHGRAPPGCGGRGQLGPEPARAGPARSHGPPAPAPSSAEAPTVHPLSFGVSALESRAGDTDCTEGIENNLSLLVTGEEH